MAKKDDILEDEPMMTSEPVAAYNYAEQSQSTHVHFTIEHSNSVKKEFLGAHLHPSTVEYLDSVDWMENKPFPIFVDDDNNSWIDEAEAIGMTDIIDDERIAKDKAAWYSVR